MAANVRVIMRLIAALRRPVSRLELPLSDVAAAVVLTVLAELQIWLTPDLHGSRPGLAVTYAVITAAVAWRRRSPMGAIAVTLVAGIASLPLESSDGANLITGLVIATLVLSYSVAAHEDRSDLAVAGLLAMLATYWLGDLRQGNPAGDYLASFIGTFGAWLAGRVVARERRHGRLLARALEEVERQRARAESAAAEAERSRIARELHDVVAHSLSVIAIQADAAELAVQRCPQDARRGMAVVRDTAHEALGEMRRLLGTLREEPRAAPAPTIAALPALRDRLAVAGGNVVLHIEGDHIDLPAAIDLSAYRIVQEGLTNARRHAPTACAEVTVRCSAEAVEICVDNDLPNGSQEPATGAGHGLIGVRERAQALGGTMTAGIRPDGGWRLYARLPIDGAP